MQTTAFIIYFMLNIGALGIDSENSSAITACMATEAQDFHLIYIDHSEVKSGFGLQNEHLNKLNALLNGLTEPNTSILTYLSNEQNPIIGTDWEEAKSIVNETLLQDARPYPNPFQDKQIMRKLLLSENKLNNISSLSIHFFLTPAYVENYKDDILWLTKHLPNELIEISDSPLNKVQVMLYVGKSENVSLFESRLEKLSSPTIAYHIVEVN